jgi:hypothetical protein
MEQIFRRIIEDNFSDLHGLTVDASIPVPEELVNEIIAAAIRGNDNIDYCKVSVGRENRVAVRLKTPFLPFALNLKLRLAEALELGDSPRLTAWLENQLFLAGIGSFLNVLPAGIRIQGNQLTVDIGSFLTAPEQKRLLKLIRWVGINTQEGKVKLAIKMGIGEAGKS